MVTTIPTAIPTPKLPPLNLDFVVVVVGLSVVGVDFVDVAWDVLVVFGVVGFVVGVDFVVVAWDVVVVFGVVGFVVGVDFVVVAWDVVMVFGVVGFVVGVDFVDVAWDVLVVFGVGVFGLIGGISVVTLGLVVAILLSNTWS